LQNESYRTYVTEFITLFQFQNSTIIEYCYWFINLLTITANHLLYFQHILMIINYFMNRILVGQLAAIHLLDTNVYEKKALGETQTLHAGRSSMEPKIFAPPLTPSRGRRTAKI